MAQRVRAALAPESGAAVPGALVAVDAPSPQEVRVRVEAPTTSALRAALNAHLRWVDLALRVERWAGERAAATPAPGLPPSGP